MAKVHIELDLTETQAKALQQALRQMYDQRLQFEFWEPRYRLIPHDMRHGSIVASCPDMAAIKKCLGALRLPQANTPTSTASA